MTFHSMCVYLTPLLPLQVVYQSRKCGFVMLYVTARDNAEVSDWVATLRKGTM